MKLLLTLTLAVFLFSSCKKIDLTPIPKPPSYIYIYEAQPTMKNLSVISTDIPRYDLKKTTHNDKSFLVKKDDLVKASKTSQSLRKVNYNQNKQLKFYRYQNDKFNNQKVTKVKE